MKKLTTLLVALVILSVTVNAAAQSDDDVKFQVGVKGGWNFWYDEPLSDSVDNNWIVGGEIKVWFPNGFGLGGEVQWTTKDELAEDNDLGIDIDYTQIPIHLNAFYRFPMEDSESVFYIGGGASFVYADATSSANVGGVNISVSTDDTAFGFNGVVGFQYGMFFVEGQWLWAEATFDLAGVDIAEDVQLGGPSFWVGVRF